VSATLSRRDGVPGTWLTPRPARALPIHRWFVFPHSFAPELVSWFVAELGIEEGMCLLDPFCGAGTTLVEGERHGLVPVGVDLLPIAVLASRAKVNRPGVAEIKAARKKSIAAVRTATPRVSQSDLLRRAFSPTAYGRLASALESAQGPAADCVRLATLSIARRFSSLVADGGWLREGAPERLPRLIPDALSDALQQMEDDIATESTVEGAEVHQADSRSLPLPDDSVDAVITSPPYPNRHDYTRVFSVELELGFALGDAVKQLRYEALHSHPEARPSRKPSRYRPSRPLTREVALVAAEHPDPRIPRMLRGYFKDLSLVLAELARVVRRGGTVAFVVGNAQYSGVPIPVDEHLAGLARRAGFEVLDIALLRLRGNSAQQMAAYGRRPSRESAVLLRLK
jgi:DNA modification methylase